MLLKLGDFKDITKTSNPVKSIEQNVCLETRY